MNVAVVAFVVANEDKDCGWIYPDCQIDCFQYKHFLPSCSLGLGH